VYFVYCTLNTNDVRRVLLVAGTLLSEFVFHASLICLTGIIVEIMFAVYVNLVLVCEL
jgi:hypothetical protein